MYISVHATYYGTWFIWPWTMLDHLGFSWGFHQQDAAPPSDVCWFIGPTNYIYIYTVVVNSSKCTNLAKKLPHHLTKKECVHFVFFCVLNFGPHRWPYPIYPIRQRSPSLSDKHSEVEGSTSTNTLKNLWSLDNGLLGIWFYHVLPKYYNLPRYMVDCWWGGYNVYEGFNYRNVGKTMPFLPPMTENGPMGATYHANKIMV